MSNGNKDGYIQEGVQVNTQDTFDSHALGSCDAYFRRLRKARTCSFKMVSLAKTVHTGAGRRKYFTWRKIGESVKALFRIVESAHGRHLHVFGICLSRSNVPVLPRRSLVELPIGSIATWCKENPYGPDVRVEGIEGRSKKFGNAKLNIQDGFSHTFLKPGKYNYHNGKKGSRATKGVVVVEPLEGTVDDIPEPALIRCTREGFDPKEVRIVTGQTVGWLIYDPGAAIVQDIR